MREDIDASRPLAERNSYERQVVAARAGLGDDVVFDLAWQDGRAMGLAKAIEYALEGHDA